MDENLYSNVDVRFWLRVKEDIGFVAQVDGVLDNLGNAHVVLDAESMVALVTHLQEYALDPLDKEG